MEKNFKSQHPLTEGTVRIIDYQDWNKKLACSRPLKIKFGIDPTASDLHLGHAVILAKLGQFQNYGHEIHLIMGDFTACIGDPSGRDKTRPSLSQETTKHHAENFIKQLSAQCGQLIQFEKIIQHYNSEWLSKIDILKFIKQQGTFTIQQILQREDFSDRLKNDQPISMTELFYPFLQAYDSVAISADIELGGTDQLFNIMTGRDLQKMLGQEPQVAILLPLLKGLDGKKKMSKSLNNAILLSDPPDEMFGKIMSIPDNLLQEYYNLLFFELLPEIEPLEAKKLLAERIIQCFHTTDSSRIARDNFEKRFSQKKLYETTLKTYYGFNKDRNIDIIHVCYDCFKSLDVEKSRTEIRRLIEQGSIVWLTLESDEVWKSTKITNPSFIFSNSAMLKLEDNGILRLGKKHAIRICCEICNV